MFGGKVKSIRNLRPSTAHPIFTASSQSPRHGFLFFCFEASRPVAGQVSESAQHPGGRRAKASGREEGRKGGDETAQRGGGGRAGSGGRGT